MRNNDLPDLLHPRPFMYGIRTPDGTACTAFTRQRRYIVLKNSDLHALALAGQLRAEDMDVLTRLSDAADRLRTVNGRPALRCVVVESDWPEYETTYTAIEKRTGAGHE